MARLVTKAPAKKAPAKKAPAAKAVGKGASSSFRGQASAAVVEPRKGTSTPKKKAKKKTEKCFIMSPFGGWFDQYYSDIYSPAIEAAGLAPCRADDLYRPSSIVHDIWAYVQEARVMLADLTNKNPNVLYELGLAHALDKPVVMLSQSIDDVPFDLRALRVITYEVAAPNWAELLRVSISSALKEVLEAPSSAVLQPFSRSKASSDAAREADQTDPVLRSLMREVNLLRSEIRQPGRPERSSIDPDEARALIRRYLAEGIPPSVIIDRLSMLGAPSTWARQELFRSRGEKTVTSEA